MKFKIKLMILSTITILFLTGCGYDDVYDKYKEELDSLNCTFVSTQYEDTDPYPSSNYRIQFTADSKGVYVTLNGQKNNLYDNNGLHTITVGDYPLDIDEETLLDFLENYRGNGCPSQIFIGVNINNPTSAELLDSCAAGDGQMGLCFLYKNAEETKDIIKSRTYKKYSDEMNRNFEFSFGYDPETKKSYFYLDNVEHEIVDKSMFVSVQAQNKYIAIDSSDYDDIFNINGDDVTFPNSNDLYLALYGMETQTVLYITTHPDKYNYVDEGEEGPLESNKDQNGFNPDRLCEDGNCDISLDNFCGEPTVSRVLKFIGLIIFIAKILVPAIIIIMGFVTLFKIMTSGKEDEAKKQVRIIVRNIIIGVLIFLLPSLINLVFDIADDIISPGETSDFANCVNCLTDPNDSSKCIIQESDD